MYFEDDDDLIAALDQTTATPPALERIADGIMSYDATFELINRYQASSPHAATGFKAGQWFETTEDIYWYFLECLPPLHQTAQGFVVMECTMGDLYEAFFEIDNRFFCAVVQWPGAKAFHLTTQVLTREVRS